MAAASMHADSQISSQMTHEKHAWQAWHPALVIWLACCLPPLTMTLSCQSIIAGARPRHGRDCLASCAHVAQTPEHRALAGSDSAWRHNHPAVGRWVLVLAAPQAGLLEDHFRAAAARRASPSGTRGARCQGHFHLPAESGASTQPFWEKSGARASPEVPSVQARGHATLRLSACGSIHRRPWLVPRFRAGC